MNGKTFHLFLIPTFALLLFCLTPSSCKQKALKSAAQANADKTRSTQVQQKDSLDMAITAFMNQFKIPGVSIVMLDKNAETTSRVYGHLQKGKDDLINEQTVFSVGSVSKVINAIMTLKLVAEGELDLDKDVDLYLKDFKINEGRTKGPVITLRHLLSHTAGTSVHGFADFYPDEPLPTTLQILNGESPAKNKKVKVILPVGQQFKYSGGGITIIQKIIEDVTQMPYHEAAYFILFKPMGMKRSSFENPLPENYENIAKAHDNNSNPVALPRGYQAMPEKAASGLWTTPGDLMRILYNIYESDQKQTAGFLPPTIIKDMTSREVNSEFGLGPYVGRYRNNTIISHNGSNESYKARFCMFWDDGVGYVILTNGSNGTEFINKIKLNIEDHLGLDSTL